MTQTKTNSKTIQGVVIMVVALILSIIAQKAGFDLSFEVIKGTLTTSVVEVTQAVTILIGAYRTLKGRLNPEIKPIGKK